MNTCTCVGNNFRRIASAVAPSLLSVDVYKTTDNRANDSILPRVYLLNQHKGMSVPLQEALRSLRAYSLTEKSETVEINLKCNMKLKMNKLRQPFRGSIVYPHMFGRQQRVLVFAEESLVEAAQKAGADVVGGTELITQIEKGFDKFDVCLCTPKLLDKVKKLQGILRAKMPAVRRGTVVEQFDEPITKLKKSREYHTDKIGHINMSVGKLNFPDDQIELNIKALIEEVLQHKDTTSRNSFIASATLSSTFGPGFHLQLKDLL